MNNSSHLDDNEKLLIDAFKLQNEQAYDEALQKLQIAGDNLIKIIEKIQSSSQFYMRYMQLMKQERDLVSEKDYKEFLAKNQKVLSRNFQKNAYLALLMEEIQEKQIQPSNKKMTIKQDEIMKKMVKQSNCSFQDIQKKFPKQRKQQLRKKFEVLTQNVKKEGQGLHLQCL